MDCAFRIRNEFLMLGTSEPNTAIPLASLRRGTGSWSGLNEFGDSVTFEVKVTPRAKRDEVVGLEGAVVKIRLRAPPVEGRANEALVKFLAGILDIPRQNVTILKGERSTRKLLRVQGVKLERIKQLCQQKP